MSTTWTTYRCTRCGTTTKQRTTALEVAHRCRGNKQHTMKPVDTTTTN